MVQYPPVLSSNPIKRLLFREDYCADPAARRALQQFLIEIHGLDLRAWEAAGHWDDRYRPFSRFDGDGRVVSSVCPPPDNSLHDRGDFPLRSERFLFPFTAHA